MRGNRQKPVSLHMLTNTVAASKISLKPAGCLHFLAVWPWLASNKDTSLTFPSPYSYSPQPLLEKRGWNCFLFVPGKSGHTLETVRYGRGDCKSWEEPPQKSEIINSIPGDTFHSRIMSYEKTLSWLLWAHLSEERCTLQTVRSQLMKSGGEGWHYSLFKVWVVEKLCIPALHFPISKMLSEWTLSLGKNLFQLKFGMGKFKLSTFAGSLWQ